MHIGLIGGIGVAATVVYYQRLAAAMSARGKRFELTIVQADAPELVKNNLADDRAAQATVYARLIDRLKAAGAECAAITSLGGHFCFAETEALSSLPLVSGVTPLDTYFADKGINRVGLLGTRVVMETCLYGQLEKTEAVTLDGETENLGQTYLNMALSGVCTDEQRAIFLDAGARLTRDHGAQAIVLAGTDLGLAFNGQSPDYRVIDALDVHVDILAGLAADEMGLDDLRTA